MVVVLQHRFYFDHVFGEESSNEEVYRKTTFPLVQHMLSGWVDADANGDLSPCSFERMIQFTYPLYICVSTEGRPPALHTDKQVQGRLTPCWVRLPGVLGCMLLQLRTFLLICAPRSHTTHLSWFMSVSLKSTVVSCTTCWTTEKGSAVIVLNDLYLFILASMKLFYWLAHFFLQ